MTPTASPDFILGFIAGTFAATFALCLIHQFAEWMTRDDAPQAPPGPQEGGTTT